MYIDPFKDVRPVLNNTIFNLRNAVFEATKPSKELRKTINQMTKFNNIYKNTLLNMGHINLINIDTSNLVKIKVPTIDISMNFRNNLFSENALQAFKTQSNFPIKEITRINNILRYSFINTVNFRSVSDSFNSPYPINNKRENRKEDDVDDTKLQKYAPPTKKIINATSLVFTPNISWSLFSGAMYNEPVNVPISIFVLIISLVCFYLTFDYKSDDK
ncbi:hypothetical protein B4W74_04590 [Staphylococcus intermedius]|uniref:Uncharacterized protein n=2 Tax=Staphylococcus delphini TaxID=53344 RepID=A0AAQ0D576_9STAP|nr:MULTISPECIES: hypothetical protein [Staphylococcus intermedius group]PCF80945.1 hypothetical protein B4W74_04590 [Staphylococcus intermedius]PCF88628.1 hypothetical protein B4W75_07620 [Staphylococcus intermedius]QUM66201.1 hypothetical protein IPU21_08665 [Staphylococcus delphini]QUM68637.1 hypothetical protein IPU22_08625 [Staphylococcus delphini]